MLRSALKADPSGFAPSFVPPPAKSAEIAQRLVERYGEGRESRKSASALEALLDRLRRVRFDWEQVEPADRLEVVWVLWSGPQPPAEHSAFLRQFLDWLETPHHGYQMARLANAWAAAFDPRLPSIRIVGDWLAAHRMWLADPWRGLAERFQLFSIDRAPALLAESLLRGHTTAIQFFDAIHLLASAIRGGLGTEILAAAIVQIANQAAQSPGLALRLCDLAGVVGVFEPAAALRLTARRRDLQKSLAEALLLPWQAEVPPTQVKASLLAFLLRHYGDMRIAPQRWRALHPSAIALMHRWLNEETVAAYFRLARRAKSAERARLAERQAFWMSRLATVDGAWLLTAAHDTASADQIARGRLGGRPDQVALLLRVGNLTVLEIVHESSERIWRAGNPLAPQLYQGPDHIYWPAALAQGVDFSSAYGAESPLAWQVRLAGFLDRENAGKSRATRSQGW